MDHTVEDVPGDRESLSGSQQALVGHVQPRGGSNSRAVKIAGLTTLAILLVASQVFTAYMVFNQKQQISTLQKSNERLGKQMSRSSPAMSPVKMAIPMNTLPLFTDFSEEDSKQPLTKVQDIAIVSVEKQLQDFLEDVSLPQFNETFMSNLKSLKEQINESDWKNFETWMKNWLIFQMAQKKPPTPTPQPESEVKTQCQLQADPKRGKVGSFKPECDEQGRYKPRQCWHATGFCWCVDESGHPIEGTAIRGRPDCRRGAPLRRMMVAPMMMQKTFDPEAK